MRTSFRSIAPRRGLDGEAVSDPVQSLTATSSVPAWPRLCAVIPADHEAGSVGRTIESLLATDYPTGRRELVVVDGSTDGTLAEAREYASGRVTVVHKESGGKHPALNRGLRANDVDGD